MPLLEVKNLTINFGKNQNNLVDRLNFSMSAGTTLGIVGESGSGKSLTALAIMGLLPPHATSTGETLFTDTNGRVTNLSTLDEKGYTKLRGSRIAMIFQEPLTALNPVMTCGKQVAEVYRIHTSYTNKEIKQKVLNLFGEVQLPDAESVYNKYPHQLSGGQRQRVGITMALACSPALIIADEPTTALDVTLQQALLQLLKELQHKHNLAIIFISHDLGVISKIADNILVMHHGRAVEYGEKEAVLHTPVSSYTKGLIACRPVKDERPVRLPIIDDVSEHGFQKAFPENEARQAHHNQLYAAHPILVIENLNTIFSQGKRLFGRNKNAFHALKAIHLEVWEGETVGLVGESGSGKTTLGRSIMQLIKSHSGSISYLNKDLTRLNKTQLKLLRKDIQLIFQDAFSALSPHVTIGDAIREPMIVHRLHGNNQKRKEKANQLLTLTGLGPEWYAKYPYQLSGGQRQRVVIARALALEPKVLICDESVSALDVSVQAQILNLLNDLKQQLRLTYIFISHDLAVVQYMSDRMVVMKSGELVETGEADQLCRFPQHAYTKTLLNAAFE